MTNQTAKPHVKMLMSIIIQRRQCEMKDQIVQHLPPFHDECARHSANQQYSLKQPSVLKSHNDDQLEKVNKSKAQRKSQTKKFNNNHDNTDSKTPRKKTNKNDFTKPMVRNERSNRTTPSSGAIEDPRTSLVTEESSLNLAQIKNKFHSLIHLSGREPFLRHMPNL